MNKYTYLALGDSYTIGEQVPIYDSFPYQTVQLLRKEMNTVNPEQGKDEFNAPEIIAKTGWTTDELNEKVVSTLFSDHYDFVSLLVGVNNQYRGKSAGNFREEFEQLLQQAILFAGGKVNRVFVLSIPDWGVTPFAADKDRLKIAVEIDQYNEICKLAAVKYHCNFIEITTSQREDGMKEDFLAADLLHPSGKEYAKWARQLSMAMRGSI